MTNCIFYTIIFVLFLNLSFGSLRISQLNRAFMSSYKGIFEASVITVDEEGEPTYPYYYQPVLNNYIEEYLEPNIKKYVTDYNLEVTYYEQDSAVPCQINDKPTIVELHLKATINYLFSFDKTQTYKVSERMN